MSNPVGNELVAVIGVAENNGPAATTEYFTTQQIADLGGGGGSGIIHEVDVSSGTTGIATAVNTIIIFDSATAADKIADIPASTGSLGQIIIMDYFGNAGTYPISVNQSVIGVDTVYTNNGSITLVDTSKGWLSV